MSIFDLDYLFYCQYSSPIPVKTQISNHIIDLVIDHVFEIFVVEVDGEIFTDINRNSFIEEFEITIDKRSRNSTESKIEDSSKKHISISSYYSLNNAPIDCGYIDRKEGTKSEENGESE